MAIVFHTFALVFKVNPSFTDRFTIDKTPKGVIFK
ncbi:hypothetical protein AsAng_0001200 [Aureispira anguillae]|uniref:Uncharacterized protein n=1 Tax=Aureispira anguillae TaxID=2864201 RepID=A0A915YAC5_9BACT|nr:hypothetical protein AsAng_0001200 [Aureispira anguillae]